MSIKIKILESAHAFDPDNINSSPIYEIKPGDEFEAKTIMKAWKPWHRVILPNGKIGLIPAATKVENLGYAAPVAGGWNNFLKVLKDNNPTRFGYNLLDCIQAYEAEIIKAIQCEDDPEIIIINCGKAGANQLLQKAMDDALIDLLKERIQSKNDRRRFYATIALIELEKNTNTGLLIPSIVEADRSHPLPADTYSPLVHNDQIINILISRLVEPFIVKSSGKNRLASEFVYDLVQDIAENAQGKTLWKSLYRPGPALEAAEILLESGVERGIREIIPHLLDYIANNDVDSISLNDPDSINVLLIRWSAEHFNLLAPYLSDGLNHKNKKARLFAINCLLATNDKSYLEEVKKLKNDPESDIRTMIEKMIES